jgi:hypothetical protein
MNAPHEAAVVAAARSATTLGIAASAYLDAYRGADENRPLRLKAWVGLWGASRWPASASKRSSALKQIATESARFSGDGYRNVRERASQIPEEEYESDAAPQKNRRLIWPKTSCQK